MTEPCTCAHCGTAEGELTEFNGRLYCEDYLDSLITTVRRNISYLILSNSVHLSSYCGKVLRQLLPPPRCKDS